MFGIGKRRLLKTIHIMQRSFCCYDMMRDGDPPSFCDCKYGYDGRGYQGEQTGCPELRLLHELLSVMSEDEYKELVSRAKVTILENGDIIEFKNTT